MAELVPHMSQALLRAFRALGLDSDDIARAAQTSDDELASTGRRVGFDLHMALWDQAVQRSGDLNLGLRVAERVTQDYEPIARAYVQVGQPLREALNGLAQAMHMLSTASRIELRSEAKGLRVVYGLTRSPWIMPRHHCEAIVGTVFLVMRRLVGEVRLREVTFQHSAPCDIEEHRDWFGCPVLFEQPHSALVIDLSCAEHPVRLSGSGAAATDRREVPGEDRLLSGIRREVVAAVGHGRSMKHVATKLGMSSLELRQALADRALTYCELVSSVRRELARAYLNDMRWTLPDIALQLGFPSVPSFRRSFQRWTGQTPGEYRRSLLG